MCSKPQLEFLTQLLLFNFTKTLTNNNSDSSNDQNVFNISVENAPLEPPTPPRTPIIASQTDVAAQSQRNATTPIDGSSTRSQNVHKSPQSVTNNDGDSAITTSRPSSPWSNVSQAAASTSISVAPASKLMGNDSFNADRLSRTSSMNDTAARDYNSDAEQEDEDEDNSSATHAFDLSFQYNDDSNASGSGEDQGSEGGTTINSFDLAMGRKDNYSDRSNDVSIFFSLVSILKPTKFFIAKFFFLIHKINTSFLSLHLLNNRLQYHHHIPSNINNKNIFKDEGKIK